MNTYCSNCGVKLTNSARFCCACGAQVPTPHGALPATANETKTIPAESDQQKATTITELAVPHEIFPQQSLSPSQEKSGSYLSRHWRGKLSLPMSWINGGLVTVIFSLTGTIVPWDDFLSIAPKIYSATAVGIWGLFALATIWQGVGIWRSADNYMYNRKEKLWGRLARAAAVLGLIGGTTQFATIGVPQIAAIANIASGNDPVGTYQLRVLRDATELELAGPITFGLTDDVRSILDAHPTIHIIHLNSQGGRVSEARKLRDLIASRGLTTYTASGCFSACTLAFAAGHERLLGRDAILGFHQYSFPGLVQQDFQSQYAKDQRDWRGRGFQEAFIEKAFKTANNDMWKPSHRELYEAGFITRYPGRNDVVVTEKIRK